jgi:hypothetical protein
MVDFGCNLANDFLHVVSLLRFFGLPPAAVPVLTPRAELSLIKNGLSIIPRLRHPFN